MKNVRLMLLAITAMLFLGMGNISAQQKQEQTVIITIYEFSAIYKSRMIVVDPSGNSKTVELKTITLKSLEETVAANSISIQSEINKWKSEGYEIDGMTANTSGDSKTSMIILSKKD